MLQQAEIGQLSKENQLHEQLIIPPELAALAYLCHCCVSAANTDASDGQSGNTV